MVLASSAALSIQESDKWTFKREISDSLWSRVLNLMKPESVDDDRRETYVPYPVHPETDAAQELRHRDELRWRLNMHIGDVIVIEPAKDKKSGFWLVLSIRFREQISALRLSDHIFSTSSCE